MSAALPGQAALVARCRQGETEAFTPLVRHYQNAAYAVALGYVRDIHEAEDVVQEGFAGDRNHRFGAGVGKGAQAGAATGGEDHALHDDWARRMMLAARIFSSVSA